VSLKIINKIFKDLFPVCRSLTGSGNMKTLNYFKNIISDLKIKKIPSSSKIFDWEVPAEWNIKDAYIKNARGKKIIDFKKNNLHLVSYSIPYQGILSKEELMPHLHTLPSKPNLIPYRTSYYKKDWGFCCSNKLLKSNDFKGPFKVFIDSSINKKGNLVYGEAYKKGKKKDEILLSTYCCHPSLANDNLSGLITAILLFEYIKNFSTQFSYRLVIAPETIGALCFLKKNKNINKILAGTIFSCTAGPDKLSIKEAYDNTHWINKISHLVLKKFTKNNYIIYPFSPEGSDERQYASPGFRIPTPSLHKSKYYEYDQYHTSGDNLNFISASNLNKTLNLYKEWFRAVDSFCYPKRKEMKGEFMLGKRNLYPGLGGSLNQKTNIRKKKQLNKNSILYGKTIITKNHLVGFNWLMHMSDGKNSNLDISKRSNLSLSLINECIKIFHEKGLITT